MWFGVGEPPALNLRVSDLQGVQWHPGEGECVGGVGKNL